MGSIVGAQAPGKAGVLVAPTEVKVAVTACKDAQ